MNSRLLLLFLNFLFISPCLLEAQEAAPKSDTIKPKKIKDSGRIALPVQKSLVTNAVDTSNKERLVAIPTVYADTTLVSRRPPSAFDLFPVRIKYKTIYGVYAGGYMKENEQFSVTAPVRRIPQLVRKVENKDWVFYFYCTLLLGLAFINLVFHKYFVDLFRVFFNTSMRQKQLREQLSQSPLPSLLLNLLFCISGSMFIYFLLKHSGISIGFHPAVQILIGIAILASIYIVKFIFVSSLGWMFDGRQAAENYIFTVMLVNKVGGLVLIPIGILMAYGDYATRQIVLTIAVLLLIILAVMRLVKGYLSVNGVKVNLIQFLVFVGAFELVPAMLIYKVLLRVFV